MGKVCEFHFLTGWSSGHPCHDLQKEGGRKKGTGSWKDVLTFLYLCQSPCPERAYAWRKLKATALHSALLPIQAKRSFEVNSQPAPCCGGLHLPYEPKACVYRSRPAGGESGDPKGTPPWTCRAMGGFLGKRVPLAFIWKWKGVPGNHPYSQGRCWKADLPTGFAGC